MNETLSMRGQQLVGSVRRTLELLDEHAKTHPDERDLILKILIAHVRSSQPQLLLTPTGGIDAG